MSLAAVIANAESGTSAIEIGDVVVQDTSIGLDQGDHGLAFSWYDTAVPVMCVKYGDLYWGRRAPLQLWQAHLELPPSGRILTPMRYGDSPVSPNSIEETDYRRRRRVDDMLSSFADGDFEDWPLHGDRTMMHSARELRRCGLNQPYIAGSVLLSLPRPLIEPAHELNPAMPGHVRTYDGATDDFIGSHGNARGAVIAPDCIAFVVGQGARDKVLEQARLAKEERFLYLTLSYDPKGKVKGKDSGPNAEGEQPVRGPREES